MGQDKKPAYDVLDILNIDPRKAKSKAEAPGTIKASSTTKKEYRSKRAYHTKRDKRLQVVLSQDLLDRLKNHAETHGASVNEIVNVALENELKKRG